MSSELSAAFELAASEIREADALVITAGAGMGVDSGLPDFRGPEGFWRAYPALGQLGLAFEEVAQPRWFETDPALAWAFYGHRLNLYRRIVPHAGFSTLLDWSQAKPLGGFVFTSNVDGHFQRAGFEPDRILECHGSLNHFQCVRPCCDDVWDAAAEVVVVDDVEFRATRPLPQCRRCERLARPNVLMFNDASWVEARTAAQEQALELWIERVWRTDAKLTIIEYLHHSEGLDRRVDLERIARMIRDTQADVVALQEIDVNTQRTGHVDQAAEYIRLTGLHGQFGKAIDFQGGAYGQMILSRWPLAEFAVHLLPNPAKREQRIATSALIAPPGMNPFRFINMHLDATGDYGDRWLQAGRLQDLFANDLLPAIMAGDFNARPESRVMTRMLLLWQDASARTPQPTFPAETPSARIDFVLVRPPGVWRVKHSEVVAEAVASDHRPLLVELGITH